MGNFWSETAADAKQGAADYKKAKAKRDKIKGVLEDIGKLHSFASNILHSDAGSSAKLLKLAYEGVGRLAQKYGGNSPVLSFFFRYHQPHMDLLANVLRARNEANFVIKWQAAADKQSKQIEAMVDELVAQNGFAGAMVNENGKLSSNVPRDFRSFCESEAFDITTPEKEVLEASKSKPSEAWIAAERARLGLVILENARDVSGAYLAVATEMKKFLKSAQTANEYFVKLNKGETDADTVFGKLAERAMQHAALEAGATSLGSQAFDEVTLFTEGKMTKTPSFQRVGKSYRRARALSENWKEWAKLVADGSHMNMY